MITACSDDDHGLPVAIDDHVLLVGGDGHFLQDPDLYLAVGHHVLPGAIHYAVMHDPRVLACRIP